MADPVRTIDSSAYGRESPLARAADWRRGYAHYVLLLVATAVAAGIALAPTPEGLTLQGQRAVAILVLCVILWVTQAIPLMITSLLAIVLFPLLGVFESGQVYPFFANEAVFFILGAFMLASAIHRSGLSSRITLMVLKRFGHSPRSLVASVMLIPAFLSFFMPQHAVAAVFFPIVAEITTTLRLRSGESPFAKSLFIAMSWGAVVGGILTFLGGARAPLAVGILQATTGRSISFVSWSLAALPTVLVMLPLGFFIIRRFFPSELDSIEPAVEAIQRKVARLGRISPREIHVAILMSLTVLTWIVWGDQLGLANIALAAVALAFALRLMTWKDVEEDVNWGVFLMYGGAIALGFALNESGASAWLVDVTITRFPAHPILIVAGMSLLVLFLTEAISNTAVVALVLPVALTLAEQQGLPAEVMALGVAIPSGLAFMLPMATPANAIAYSSGHLRPIDTARAGLFMNLSAWLAFVISAALWWPLIGFGT